MPFEFIDNSVIDRSARRKIRSHVMMDKNLGKTRPPRKKVLRPIKTTLLPMVIKAAEPEVKRCLLSPSQQIGTKLSLLQYPAELTFRSRGLVQKFIVQVGEVINEPALCCQSVDVSSSIWIQYIFLDEAYFHCFVATSILYNNSNSLVSNDNVEALKHLSQAINLINERLSGDEALSDQTIATIVGLIRHERLQNQHHTAVIHFAGLRRVIDLRGGVEHLMSNPHLANKIFRVDIEFALYNGTATQFHTADLPGDILPLLRRNLPLTQNEGKAFDLFSHLSSDIQQVFSDTLTLARLLNNHKSPPTKLNVYAFQEAVINVSYRLIQIRPLAGPRPPNPLEDIVHLTLTGFVTTLFLGFGPVLSKAPLLPKLIRASIQRFSAADRESQELLLWVLVMGRASAFTALDECWLVRMARELVVALELGNWEEMGCVLSQFPWVELVHGQAGRAFWERADTCGKFGGEI